MGNQLVHSQKLLIIDNRLTWMAHIRKLTKTIGQNLALLNRIKQYLPIFARKIFYISYIQQSLDCCSTIWGFGIGVIKLSITKKSNTNDTK